MCFLSDSPTLTHIFLEIIYTFWSPCNKSCDKGFKSREAVCYIEGREASPNECNGFTRTIGTVTCIIRTCPAPGIVRLTRDAWSNKTYNIFLFCHQKILLRLRNPATPWQPMPALKKSTSSPMGIHKRYGKQVQPFRTHQTHGLRLVNHNNKVGISLFSIKLSSRELYHEQVVIEKRCRRVSLSKQTKEIFHGNTYL